jgi:hypothetical protein
MQSKLTYIVVLLALMFNIAHASLIAAEDHCVHKGISEYIGEMSQNQECDDLCDIHHLFHFSAIITSETIVFTTPKYTEQPDSELLSYHPPFSKTENKPPIA